VLVYRRQAEAGSRVIYKIEFNDDRRHVADNPAVVAGFDDDHLRRNIIEGAAVGELHMDMASGKETDVGMHAGFGADVRLDIARAPGIGASRGSVAIAASSEKKFRSAEGYRRGHSHSMLARLLHHLQQNLPGIRRTCDLPWESDAAAAHTILGL
jgi:hypothetical protein